MRQQTAYSSNERFALVPCRRSLYFIRSKIVFIQNQISESPLLKFINSFEIYHFFLTFLTKPYRTKIILNDSKCSIFI